MLRGKRLLFCLVTVIGCGQGTGGMQPTCTGSSCNHDLGHGGSGGNGGDGGGA